MQGLRRSLPIVLGMAAVFVAFTGLDWGLPSRERVSLFLGANAGEAVEAVSRSLAVDRERKKGRAGPYPIPLQGWATAVQEITADPDELIRVYRRYFLFSHHPDEILTLMAISSMNPQVLDFDPKFYAYGGLFIYPIAASLKVASLTGLVTLTDDPEHYLRHPEEFGRFFLLGRLWVAILFLFSVWAVFRTASLYDSPAVGLVAATFFILTPASANWAHVLKPHLPGTLFVILALFYALRHLAEGRERQLLASAFFAGMAASMVIHYGLSLLFPLIVLWLRKEVQKWWKGLLTLLIAAVTFTALNPYLFLNLQRASKEAQHVAGWYGLGSIWSAPWHYYTTAGVAALGPALAVVVPIALAWAFLFPSSRFLVLTIPGLLYFLLISWAMGRNPLDPLNARFGFFVFPFLIITASFLIAVVKRHHLLGGLLLIGMLASTVLSSFGYLTDYYLESTRENSRYNAARWVNANLQVGETIGALEDVAPYSFPPVRFAKFRVFRLRGPLDAIEWKDGLPNYLLILSHEAPQVKGYRIERAFADDPDTRWLPFLRPMTFANKPVYLMRRLPAP